MAKSVLVDAGFIVVLSNRDTPYQIRRTRDGVTYEWGAKFP
jgi:hypothetical protein